jgi:hypothetical protein
VSVLVVGVDGSGCADCARARALELAKDIGDEILITSRDVRAHRAVTGSLALRST